MIGDEKECAECGTTFPRPQGRSARQWAERQFCSPACSTASRLAESPPRPCATCGTQMTRGYRPDGRREFLEDWRDRRYCSLSCMDVWRASRAHGARLLICRTCPQCSDLLPARRFRRRKDGTYQRECMACIASQQRATRSEEVARRARERADRRLAAMQRETSQTASRHGQQWTGAELEEAARADVPIRVLAERLGRTYATTALHRHRARTGRK